MAVGSNPDGISAPVARDNRLRQARRNRSFAFGWVSRLILLLMLGAMGALTAGYFVFQNRIGVHAGSSRLISERAELLTTGKEFPTALVRTDRVGIVVLTGDSARIAAGLKLLEQGVSDRVLISGVHKRTSRRALLRVANYTGVSLPCCLDIGHTARDTRGNAKETAQWAKTHGYGKLVVVTSDYHMPRSLLEFSSAMPHVELIPAVANSAHTAGAISDRHHEAAWLRLSVKEYCKFLAAYGRILIEGNPAPVFATAKSF